MGWRLPQSAALPGTISDGGNVRTYANHSLSVYVAQSRVSRISNAHAVGNTDRMSLTSYPIRRGLHDLSVSMGDRVYAERCIGLVAAPLRTTCCLSVIRRKIG